MAPSPLLPQPAEQAQQVALLLRAEALRGRAGDAGADADQLERQFVAVVAELHEAAAAVLRIPTTRCTRPLSGVTQ